MGRRRGQWKRGAFVDSLSFSCHHSPSRAVNGTSGGRLARPGTPDRFPRGVTGIPRKQERGVADAPFIYGAHMNTTDTSAASTGPTFSFRRMGGLDQVLLSTDEEWRQLDQLDPKLWMALSCPTHGLEFDARTLSLLDTDQDGRIRSADILEAVAWVCERVKHPARLTQPGTGLPLDNLRDDTPQGAELLAAARLVQEKSGRTEAGEISPEQAGAALAAVTDYAFNGDGIVPPFSVDKDDEQTARFIRLGLSIVGGKRDDSGRPGLDSALAGVFLDRLRAARDWRQSVHQAALPLGHDTSAAWTLLQRLGPKIDDYFNRCRMAAFAPQALAALNEENELTPSDEGGQALFSLEALTRLPLARVAPDQPLPLTHGVNPAWDDDLSAFRQLLAPLIHTTPSGEGKGGCPVPASDEADSAEASASDVPAESLSEKNWRAIQERFAPYAELLTRKPGYERPPDDAKRVDFPGLPPLALAGEDDPLQRAFLPTAPEEALDKLSAAELDALLDGKVEQSFAGYVRRDLAAPRMAAVRDLEKLTLLHIHLYTLLMNFVSFADFYDPERRAIFLAGTLYLDSRACFLCVPVTDLDTHVRLASQSHLCLVYSQCRRTNSNGEEKTGVIAAALTAGGTATLIEGRHGVFVDNAGRDWDTSVLRLVRNPISLREAMWAPYIRFGNLVADQLQKLVAAKDDALSKASSKAVTALDKDIKADASAAASGAPPKTSFDFAKGAGIFAAFSVGISVVSAAFAYIANSVFSLGRWWPVALLILFVCISGPSMLLAWFKLRRRSLGPLLDASGWAVNNGAPINIAVGAALTAVGQLPPGAHRSLDDPYSLHAQLLRKKYRGRLRAAALTILVLLAAGLAFWFWKEGVPAWLAHWLPAWGK